MPVTAGKEEASRNRVRMLPLVAVRVQKVGSFRPVRKTLDVEQARVILGEKSTLDATQPTRERADRDANTAFRRERVRAILLEEW